MYFPYLRGKQFELLAVKEMAQSGTLKKWVHPVIEPVRVLQKGALERCITELRDNGIECTLILNPQVGDLARDGQSTKTIIEFLNDKPELTGHINLGMLITPTTSVPELVGQLANLSSTKKKVTLLHLDYPENQDQVIQLLDEYDVERQFATSKSALRLYSRLDSFETYRDSWESIPTVKWKDQFPKQIRNLDYVNVAEQIFSDEHLYYSMDGYEGISDFQTIGSEYQDGGRLPRAVVLHLTFQKRGQGPIYIRHFASDSNLDSSDTAGKFAEAVKKLVDFADETGLENMALEKYRLLHSEGGFPGLGSLKKLSIQNHIYVMQEAIAQL